MGFRPPYHRTGENALVPNSSPGVSRTQPSRWVSQRTRRTVTQPAAVLLLHLPRSHSVAPLRCHAARRPDTPCCCSAHRTVEAVTLHSDATGLFTCDHDRPTDAMAAHRSCLAILSDRPTSTWRTAARGRSCTATANDDERSNDACKAQPHDKYKDDHRHNLHNGCGGLGEAILINELFSPGGSVLGDKP